MDFDPVIVEELAYKLAWRRYAQQNELNPDSDRTEFETSLWFNTFFTRTSIRENYREDARVCLRYLHEESKNSDVPELSPVKADPRLHNLWRHFECCNGHKWDALVRLSQLSTNTSGEITESCPECHRRHVFASPVFLKDGMPWLKNQPGRPLPLRSGAPSKSAPPPTPSSMPIT